MNRTRLDQTQIAGLGEALNEATLLGAEVSAERRIAALTLSVLTLPETGPAPEDPRVQILLYPVGRVWALQEAGKQGSVRKFELDALLETVQSYNGLPIYGWEFIDTPFDEKAYPVPSLDVRFSPGGLDHSIFLFQELGPGLNLDFRIWFDWLELRTPSAEPIDIDAFIAGGKRWWDGLYARDPRTSGAGIFPGAPVISDSPERDDKGKP